MSRIREVMEVDVTKRRSVMLPALFTLCDAPYGVNLRAQEDEEGSSIPTSVLSEELPTHDIFLFFLGGGSGPSCSGQWEPSFMQKP